MKEGLQVFNLDCDYDFEEKDKCEYDNTDKQ